MKQAVFILVMGACLIAPWFLVGLKLWGIMFSIIVGLVVVFELISLYVTKRKGKGRTLSQQFWDYSKKEPRKAIAVLVSITVGWVALVWHLAEKLNKAAW